MHFMYKFYTTGSSNTNPAKVTPVLSLIKQYNFKYCKDFQFSIKYNFIWGSLMQLIISCLFTIFKLQLVLELPVLTHKSSYFRQLIGIYQFAKLENDCIAVMDNDYLTI